MNKIFLIGNLTKDVEDNSTREFDIAHFSLAVNRPATEDGEEVADFFNVVALGTLAANCIKYLSKGKKIALSGIMHFNKYTDKDGNTRYYPEVLAREVEFLTPVEKEDNAKKAFSKRR